LSAKLPEVVEQVGYLIWIAEDAGVQVIELAGLGSAACCTGAAAGWSAT
jgi:hypothetical protein